MALLINKVSATTMWPPMGLLSTISMLQQVAAESWTGTSLAEQLHVLLAHTGMFGKGLQFLLLKGSDGDSLVLAGPRGWGLVLPWVLGSGEDWPAHGRPHRMWQSKGHSFSVGWGEGFAGFLPSAAKHGSLQKGMMPGLATWAVSTLSPCLAGSGFYRKN